ncbi:hypothetical protein EB118_03080 [bacterium]|nr:hypothetical protein [bacterium]NDC93948.1 hypothetical protein [bacterium]NDD83443.1 hypothetical protein [bacterium]NDG29068.1 hypothetical protein [bacterium]
MSTDEQKAALQAGLDVYKSDAQAQTDRQNLVVGGTVGLTGSVVISSMAIICIIVVCILGFIIIGKA